MLKAIVVTLICFICYPAYLTSQDSESLYRSDNSCLDEINLKISRGKFNEVFSDLNYVLECTETSKEISKFLDVLYEYTTKNKFRKIQNQDDNVLLVLDSIANRLDYSDSSNLAKTFFIQGGIYYSNSKWDKSQNHFEESFFYAHNQSLDSIAAVALKYLGNIYYTTGKYRTALEYYIRSLRELQSRKVYTSNILMSSLYQNIGISFSMLNQNDSALLYMIESLRLKEAIFDSNSTMLASGYLNLSRLYQINGELDKAMRLIDKAEIIYVNSKNANAKILASLYLNKGSILINLNDFEEALHYHELALEQLEHIDESNDEIFIGLYLNFGLIYINLEQYDNAIFFLEKLLEMNLNYEQRVKANLFLGSALMNQNKIDLSNDNFLSAINVAQKYLGFHNIQTANSYLSYGVFCEQVERKETAIKYYQIAAEIYKNLFGNKGRDLSNTYTTLGFIYATYEPAKSLEYFQRALIAYVSNFEDVDVLTNPSATDLEADLNLFYTLFGKSVGLYRYYLLDGKDFQILAISKNTINLAINLLEKIKSTLQGENTKLLINSRASEIYDLAVTVAYELYSITGDDQYLEQSFAYSEKSKAAVLLSSVKQMEALEIGNLPDDVKEKERRLKRTITQYQNIIFEENQKSTLDSIKVARIRNRLFETKLVYDSLILYLESNYPDYYNLKYNFDVIDVKGIQYSLTPGQTLLEYKLTDSLLYAYIINRDTVILIRKASGPAFKDSINTYRNLMSMLPQADSLRFRSFSFARKGLYLSKMLEINNPVVMESENLIIIPDDILGYLSFDALVTELPDRNKCSYNKLSYLIERSSLTYGYSGTLLFDRKEKKVETQRVLAIAPTYTNSSIQDYAQRDGSFTDLEKYLIPLPNTQDEVASISTIYNTDLLIGKDAAESEFKSEASRYSILHFAMHTLINDDDPLSSKLVFSLGNDTVDDGFLNTYEIYNLDLNAELAVLSACRTGSGKLSKGEGIMSLARGFLYAGVPGIIMTLWAVEDISGADIVSGFYQKLHDGQTKDMALRNSKLSYLEHADQLRAHPYFWAAYVQIGDNSPILAPKNTYKYILVTAFFLVAIIAFIVLQRRNRRSKTNPN